MLKKKMGEILRASKVEFITYYFSRKSGFQEIINIKWCQGENFSFIT